MASTSFSPPLNGAFSPFDIFNDGGVINTPPPTSLGLPGGPCNFVDLTHGLNGAKCGCRRFWSRQVAGAGNHTQHQMGWCMCSHHACFHDDAQNSQATSAPIVDNVPGQENEKPRSNRAPLSPVQDLPSFNMPSSLGAAAVDLATMDFDSFSSNIGLCANLPQPNPPGSALDADSMPDTLSWKNVISTQEGQTSIPPIPSQCLMPQSQSASTTTSSQMRYLRPFGGKGLNTLSSVAPSRDRDQIRDGIAIPTASVGIALGINKDGQTCDDAITVPSGAATPTPGPSQAMEPPCLASVLSAGQNNEAIQNLTDTVNGHEQRLDKLESGSIYNIGHEDCSERHELADLRVTELETRMDDVERRLNDDSTSVASSRRTIQLDDDATISVVSGSINAPARAADRAALSGQLEALQARVNQLEASSLPSYNTPWALEVVFLLFPLHGIWQEAPDFKTPRLSGGREEWTQMPNTNSRATPDPQTLASHDEWAGQDSGWLLPRACVPGRMIDQRLRSRGLIKTVQVRGGDARSVQLAIGNAFESILRMMPSPAGPRSPYASDSRVDRFFGLQQSWVPLRKVHKDARLRFLSPAEMLNPVLWDATFLMDSVVMKATGMHRLYITQPDAYLQDNHLLGYYGVNSGWTWRRLRELTRIYPDSQGSNSTTDVPEADALEEYWAWNARLDEPPSARQSVVSLHQSHEKGINMSRTSDGSTQQFFTVPSNPVASMASPVMTRGQSPLIQRERKGSRPPFVRTGSIPLINSPVLPSPSRSSRRVSSYSTIPAISGPSYQRHSSPLATSRPSSRIPMAVNTPTVAMITKHRRRSTRSPSVRLNNTPRWSHRSYSRSPSVTPFPFQNFHVEEPIRGDRRTTPFAYATPYSNAPPEYPPPRLHSRSTDIYEEDDEDMDFDDDRGSSTDSHCGESDGDMAEDDDPDIDVYEDDEADQLDNLESDSDGRHHPAGQRQHSGPEDHQQSSQLQGPEDEPWPGIEDNIMSDGENVDPFEGVDDNADNRSDVSSQPSEYPSTQRAWRLPALGEGREMTHALEEGDDAGGIGFRIHEDDSEEPEAQNQW